MTKAKQILTAQLPNRRNFDVTSSKDVAAFRLFLTNNRWSDSGTCPFNIEYPHVSIPDMIKDKLIHHYLKVPYDNIES